jgi:hypothetical protein
MVRAFRFAVQATKATSAAEWRDLARQTEDLGYYVTIPGEQFVAFAPVLARLSGT